MCSLRERWETRSNVFGIWSNAVQLGAWYGWDVYNSISDGERRNHFIQYFQGAIDFHDLHRKRTDTLR